MADRPILFSAPMVRALLDGSKTQTRRMLKLGNRRPEYIGPQGCTDDPSCWGWSDDDRGDYWLVQSGNSDTGYLEWSDWQGAYAPGDRLWVREAFRGDKGYDAYPPREWSGWPVHYEADGAGAIDPGRIRPSIHMPRWASRITLTVTDVRVQRLQDISEVDVIAEGCPVDPHYHDTTQDGSNPHMVQLAPWRWQSPRAWFHDLWERLHGADAWEANPWVCALTFAVQRGNIDQEKPHA
ncbi:MAG: hypothetical protein MEQ74_12075 [Paracoccus sp.]|nr:hypothetical protein [Paracoccus sp. (in: a-proteobacteria)]